MDRLRNCNINTQYLELLVEAQNRNKNRSRDKPSTVSCGSCGCRPRRLLVASSSGPFATLLIKYLENKGKRKDALDRIRQLKRVHGN